MTKNITAPVRNHNMRPPDADVFLGAGTGCDHDAAPAD
jgi:hypothetical protein